VTARRRYGGAVLKVRNVDRGGVYAMNSILFGYGVAKAFTTTDEMLIGFALAALAVTNILYIHASVKRGGVESE
jgi:hypothetical protein